MAITVRESNEKDGIKGWTARGIWENAKGGDAFVDSDDWLYVVNNVPEERYVVFVGVDGWLRIFTSLEELEQYLGTEILHPVDLDIRWTRK